MTNLERILKSEMLTGRDLVGLMRKNGFGLTSGAILALRRGERKPSLWSAYAIASALSRPVEDVFPMSEILDKKEKT